MLKNPRVAWAVLALMLVLVFSGVLNRARDMVFHPWALAEPPLLAQWVGHVTPGNGVRLVVAMDLRRDYNDDGSICTNCNQIEGTAATCDARGTLLRYRIAGSPRDRQGTVLHLGAIPEPQPPPEGLELDVLSGTWDGGDVLDLEADFHWRRAGAAVSSTDDPATQPVPIRMQRTTALDLDALCRRFAP
jgi:hypothetical protein